MHLRCQSFVAVAAASSSCRLPRIFLAAFLLTTWLMAQPTDGRPLDRQRRAVISDVIGDTASLSNPCGSTPATSASASSCPGDGSVRRYAERAKGNLVALQQKLDPTPHSDLSLTPAIYQPVTTAEMTNTQKLREIYRSLVHHAAHLHAIKAQAKNYTNEYRNAVGDVMHVQCSLKCAANVSSAEAEEFANTAAAVDAYGYTSDSEQTMRDIAVVQDTIALLDKLIAEVAG